MGGELTCEKDKAPTRLTCSQCASPICPQCFVRTPVGLKCSTCGEGGTREAALPRSRPWLVPVILGVVLLAVLGLPRLFSDDSTTPDEVEAPPVGGASPTPEAPARVGMIGEETLDGSAAFVVTDFSCGPTEVGSSDSLRRAQGRYCLLSVTVRNVGRGPVNLLGPAQALLDGQGRRYGIDERATAAHPVNLGRDPVASVINPSNVLQSVFVFDMPPDVEPVFANLRASPRGQGATVRLTAPR